MTQRAYRRRTDGVLELLPRRTPAWRELLVSAAMAAGGIALTATVALAVATHVRPSNFQRTAGPAAVCWNWSAGTAGGCYTR